MQIYNITYNPFQENTFLLVDEHNNCVIIDPGCYFKEEKDHFLQVIKEKKFRPVALLNTHAHLDHIMGNHWVLQHFEIPLYLHKDDSFLLDAGMQSAQMYGLKEFIESPKPNFWLEEGQQLSFGNIQLDVIHTPGHAPGHVVFYNKENATLINGDVLFQGSYGRVDLPGGDFAQLKDSITKKLFLLPDETTVYTGHGPATTIGREKMSNPILGSL